MTSGGALDLSTGQHVRVSGALANAAGAVNVNAQFLDVTASTAPALLQAGTDLSVTAGEVTVQGGSTAGASAGIRGGPGTFSVTTTGDVLLSGGSGSGAFARLYGDPDVTLSVGGAIQMTAGTGSGAYARIESASPTSINVTFPNLGSGGYFVNGVEGVVASGDSGFFAGGTPAVLGTNLLVTYGQTPPAPPTPPPAPSEDGSIDTGWSTDPSNSVVAATNEAVSSIASASEPLSAPADTTQPEPEAKADKKEEEKKDAKADVAKKESDEKAARKRPPVCN
ncbi:MAG: hypothetical protein HYY79_11120 [Betaproteobacteria bacterium]|nr:hypothetical protein [Betaproteobacteria bacterium]